MCIPNFSSELYRWHLFGDVADCGVFVSWGFLGLVNLAVSFLIYRSTRLEAKQRIELEYEITTRRASALSLPTSFTYLSFFTGVLNTGGAYLRFGRIYFLEFPTIASFAAWINDFNSRGQEELMEFLEAKWIVAINDWTSLFLAMTFVLAACFNFATVRELRLRDRWVKEMLLPVFRPSWRSLEADEKGACVVSGQRFALTGEKDAATFVNQVEEGDGKSFAVFSPLCNKRASC
ncbi:hypothetical protein M413DRAFT_138004 [Hebeloma cylindrosporum]|uniref:Uncharacterized protein n=1 Tax=Hebeloma cylindrosporum TaxID=76867 RepID=A0A0C3CDV2_HEBCY|nr:hypothetical protein M413DRAFT_138004 [Hebeloma cylindrosporum h7]